MERINKAALLINLLFFGTKKEEIYQNPLLNLPVPRAWCYRFILGIYLCVQRKKGLIRL